MAGTKTAFFGIFKPTSPPSEQGNSARSPGGNFVGGTLGVLAGIGMSSVPGIGPIIAAGPIVAVMAGLGLRGAMGGLLGSRFTTNAIEGSTSTGAGSSTLHPSAAVR